MMVLAQAMYVCVEVSLNKWLCYAQLECNIEPAVRPSTISKLKLSLVRYSGLLTGLLTGGPTGYLVAKFAALSESVKLARFAQEHYLIDAVDSVE